MFNLSAALPLRILISNRNTSRLTLGANSMRCSYGYWYQTRRSVKTSPGISSKSPSKQRRNTLPNNPSGGYNRTPKLTCQWDTFMMNHDSHYTYPGQKDLVRSIQLDSIKSNIFKRIISYDAQQIICRYDPIISYGNHEILYIYIYTYIDHQEGTYFLGI